MSRSWLLIWKWNWLWCHHLHPETVHSLRWISFSSQKLRRCCTCPALLWVSASGCCSQTWCRECRRCADSRVIRREAGGILESTKHFELLLLEGISYNLQEKKCISYIWRMFHHSAEMWVEFDLKTISDLPIKPYDDEIFSLVVSIAG